MSWIKKRIESFGYAFNGIRILAGETPNASIHFVVAIVAITLGFLFRISGGEWLALIIAIGSLLSMEAMNTALERLSDYACNNELHPTIKKVKDLAAAAVLIAAIVLLAVGIIIFLPRIF